VLVVIATLLNPCKTHFHHYGTLFWILDRQNWVGCFAVCRESEISRVKPDGAPATADVNLRKYFVCPEFGHIDLPATILDLHGKIMVWHLPHIITRTRNVFIISSDASVPPLNLFHYSRLTSTMLYLVLKTHCKHHSRHLQHWPCGGSLVSLGQDLRQSSSPELQICHLQYSCKVIQSVVTVIISIYFSLKHISLETGGLFLYVYRIEEHRGWGIFDIIVQCWATAQLHAGTYASNILCSWHGSFDEVEVWRYSCKSTSPHTIVNIHILRHPSNIQPYHCAT